MALICINTHPVSRCASEEDAVQHEQEVIDFFNKLSFLPDYECAVQKQWQDFAHSNVPAKIIPSTLHQLSDEIFEGMDTKNGVDIFADGEYLVIAVYGSSYTSSDGRTGMNTIALKILPYDEERNFLNVADYIQFDMPVSTATVQFQ